MYKPKHPKKKKKYNQIREREKESKLTSPARLGLHGLGLARPGLRATWVLHGLGLDPIQWTHSHPHPNRSMSVRTYVCSLVKNLLRTYVTYLCKLANPFDKTHSTCNWVVLGVFNTSRNKVSRSSVEVIKSVQEKASWSESSLILDTFSIATSTPAIYRELQNQFFWFDFLGIREYAFGPSFLLTLNI